MTLLHGQQTSKVYLHVLEDLALAMRMEPSDHVDTHIQEREISKRVDKRSGSHLTEGRWWPNVRFRFAWPQQKASVDLDMREASTNI